MMKDRLLKGSVFELINFILILTKGILIIPVILSYWSSTKYALLISILSFVELTKLLNVGYQIYIRNLINNIYHQDIQKAKYYLGSGLRFAFVLGIFEFTIGTLVILYTKLDILIFKVNLIDTEKFSIIFYLFVWSCLGSVSGIVSHLLQTTGKYVVEVYYMIIQLFFQILILLTSSFFDFNISTVILMYGSVFFVLTFLFLIDVKKKCSVFFPIFQFGSIYQGASMFKKSIFISYSNSLELLLSNGLSLVVIAFLNPVSLVTFNATKTITNSISQISNLFVNPALPEMIKLYSLNKFDRILQLIKLYWLLIVSFLSVGIIIVQPVLDDLFLLWTRYKLIYPQVLFLLLLFSTLINVFNKPINSFLISTNNLKYISITTTIKFFTFLLFFYPLIKIFGFNSIGFLFLLSEMIILMYTFYILKKHKLILNSGVSFISNFVYMLPIIITIFSVTLLYYFNSFLSQIFIISISIIMIIYYFIIKWHKSLINSF